MPAKRKLISLSAIGIDQPGLVSRIARKVFQLRGNILDVEEHCRRGLFSIFLIIDFTAAEQSTADLTRLLADIKKETGLRTVITDIDEEALSYSSSPEYHLVTVTGLDRPGIIARISDFFSRRNINIESCRMASRGRLFSMSLRVDTGKMAMGDGDAVKTIDQMKHELKNLCAHMSQSVVIQSENVHSPLKKLVVFDVETTLIKHVSVDALVGQAGVRDKAIEGQLACVSDYGDQLATLKDSAARLAGTPAEELESIGDYLVLTPGAVELIRILKSMGFKVALLSSCFSFLTRKIFSAPGVDYAFCNTLEQDDDGVLTGKLEEPIITNDTKDNILDFIISNENIAREQVIAVGDGSSRTHFLKNVGLSIAFQPKTPNVDTDGVLSSDTISNILYCMGIPDAELEKYSF
ncbi:MAG: HAD-IB family phosphatase [Desulfobacteraceae bacterium]|nr:HAD-IB family phosphatase [Desulfobacteraceae bacterium]